MKKLIGIGIASLVMLVGCGNNEEVVQPEEDPIEQEEAQDTSTDDPLEFVNKDSEYDTLIDAANEYEILNYYVSDDTDEQGFNIYEDGDFTMRYALVETENIADVDAEGNKEIQILGEIINDTDETYYFMDRMLIKTDDKEVAEVEFGLNGAGAADEKNKFIDYFWLEYDIPESFTFVLADPSFKGDFQDAFEEENSPEYVEEDFPYEEKYKEYMKQHLVIEEEFHKE